MTKITYAKVDGPPDDWYGLRVFVANSEVEVRDVIEVNAAEGWLVRAKRNAKGELFLVDGKAEVATERLAGNFEIRRTC